MVTSMLTYTSLRSQINFRKAAKFGCPNLNGGPGLNINYLRKILHKTLLSNGSQTCDTCSSLHRCLRSDMVMTYMESKIILKKVDVKCHIIKVILFWVKVLIAEKKEKVTFD